MRPILVRSLRRLILRWSLEGWSHSIGNHSFSQKILPLNFCYPVFRQQTSGLWLCRGQGAIPTADAPARVAPLAETISESRRVSTIIWPRANSAAHSDESSLSVGFLSLSIQMSDNYANSGSLLRPFAFFLNLWMDFPMCCSLKCNPAAPTRRVRIQHPDMRRLVVTSVRSFFFFS